MRRIITEVQSLGIRAPAKTDMRNGGAGPAEGCTFLFADKAVNVPMGQPYVLQSPYQLKPQGNDYLLLKEGRECCQLSLPSRPKFYAYSSHQGLDYPKIAILHGKDCLASTVLQSCSYWETPAQCAFCAIGVSLANKQTILKKSPQQLAEVAQKAKELDRIKHVVLTTGTASPPGEEIWHLANCARAIKEKADLPVHVQFAPPQDLSLLSLLKDSGVDTVGIHIESLNPQVLEKMAPAKAKIGIRDYEKSWKRAVQIFGANQVSSFLIAGLGEKLDSIISGSEILADMGVYPFIVPLRPIKGSKLEDCQPPAPEFMVQVYEKVAEVLTRKGLAASRSLAGCVRCSACSALDLYENSSAILICHSVRNEQELQEAHAIRREVFVQEQAVFENSDLDKYDQLSTHLVVKSKGSIIGTVRIYPDPDKSGDWVGSRLAVRKEHRAYRVGRLLIREAMKRVKKRGAVNFKAHIQLSNVRFFEKVGWNCVGPVQEFCGLPHQLMHADLEKIKD